MEHDLIAWLSRRAPCHDRLRLGIGDDAALIDLAPGRALVATTDILTDGVDFRLDEADPRRIGRKALAVNLSDLAAMAARPLAAVVSLALPRTRDLRLATELYEGIFPLAERFDVAIAGGDTNTWDGGLVISVTALGEVDPARAWRRSGAKAGDCLLVTGTFGGSILGRHFDFVPRVAEALALAEHEIHAAMDVSDGLSLDLWRMCQASGMGAEMWLDRVPIDPAAHELSANSRGGDTPLDHALSDGEDFELLLAVDEETAGRLLRSRPLATPLTHIGRFVSEVGLWSVDGGGRVPLTPRGYEHHLSPHAKGGAESA